MGTHKKHLGEALLMNTHIVCFDGEIKILTVFGVVKYYFLDGKKKKSIFESYEFRIFLLLLFFFFFCCNYLNLHESL